MGRPQMPDDNPQEKDAFQRWLPVGLGIASLILAIFVGYEIFTFVRLFL
jgi:uncharacterized membrane protein YukC